MSAPPSPAPTSYQGEYTCTKGDASMEAFCMSFDFLVAAGYLLLVVFSLRVLLAKLAQEQERKWQIFFHSFLMVGCICRCVYMCMLPFSFNWQSYHIILNTLPSFFFYSAYFVFLFFWAELYHNRAGRMTNFRLPYILLNVVLYTIIIFLYVLDAIIYPFCVDEVCRDDPYLNPTEVTIHIYTITPYIILGAGYAFYGTSLFLTFHRLPAGNIQKRDDQRTLLFKLGSITTIMTVFLITRFIVVILWLTLDWSTAWFFDPIYFLFLEVLPVSILFKLFAMSTSSSQNNNQVAANALTRGKDAPTVVSSNNHYGSTLSSNSAGGGSSETSSLLRS